MCSQRDERESKQTSFNGEAAHEDTHTGPIPRHDAGSSLWSTRENNKPSVYEGREWALSLGESGNPRERLALVVDAFRFIFFFSVIYLLTHFLFCQKADSRYVYARRSPVRCRLHNSLPNRRVPIFGWQTLAETSSIIVVRQKLHSCRFTNATERSNMSFHQYACRTGSRP